MALTPQEQVLLGPGATPINPNSQYIQPTSSSGLNYTPVNNYSSVNPTYAQGVVSNQSTPPVSNTSVLGQNTSANSSQLNYTPAGNTSNNNNNPSPTPQDTGTVNKGNLLNKFPGYAGWNLDSAWADYLATGGAGKGVSNSSSGYTSPEGITYGSQEEYNRLIDEAYNPQIGALNEQEKNLNLGQTSALQEAQNAFNTQQGLAQGQLTKAQGSLTDVATKGQQAYETALAEARRVYDQLQRGYQQRFGGSSSAGQAATEIGNIERLKQQGQSYKQLQDVNRQVELGKQDVQSQYDQNILQLEQNKQSAINSIQSDFRDKLAQINASKGMVESAKAQAKLQALQQLRAEVLQIQQQETSFKQQLEAAKQQAQIQLDTYAKQLALSQNNAASNANTGINALGKPVNTSGSTVQYAASGINPGYTYTPTGQVGKRYDYATNSWV